MKFEMETKHIEAKERIVDLSEWTVEQSPDLNTFIGSSLFAELDPEFHRHVCETLGVNSYMVTTENGIGKVVLGDPIFGDENEIVQKYPIIDGKVQKNPE